MSVVTVRRVSVLKVPHSRGWRWRQPPVTALPPVGFLKGSHKSFLKGSLKGLLVWRSPRWRGLVFPRFPGSPWEVLPDLL